MHACGVVYCSVEKCKLFSAPEKPVLRVDETTGTTVSISWTISTDSVVKSYVVEWDGGSDDTLLNTTTSYTITGLEEGSSYSITVTAVNVAGSTDSDTVTVTTPEGV